MASFNRVILMGNLTRDPEVRAVGTSGMRVARLGLAVSERRKDRSGQTVDNPVFIDVDAWDRLAELCGQYLKKGSPVLVEGRLQMDSWEKDGVRHSKLKVRAVTVKFLSARDRSEPLAPAAAAACPSGERPAAPADAALAPNPLESDPDDIPF